MKLILLCSLSLLSLPALALDPGPSSPQQQETERWLTLQSRNQAASHTPQTASAAEREKAMARFLKSFEHEIPDFYGQDTAGTVEGN
jgi:hypothetical protein